MPTSQCQDHLLGPAALQPAIRAGDRDREETAALLGQGLARGYLEMHEYEHRLQATFAAQTAAELRAVVADLPASSLRRSDPRRRAARQAAARRSVHAHLAAYLALVVIVLTVWLAVALTVGAWYFWPIWPMLGGAVGFVGHALPVGLAIRGYHRVA
jgi:fatty acid desaturase